MHQQDTPSQIDTVAQSVRHLGTACGKPIPAPRTACRAPRRLCPGKNRILASLERAPERAAELVASGTPLKNLLVSKQALFVPALG